MGTFLLCCLWGQGWIGGSKLGALGWLWTRIAARPAAERVRRTPS